MAKSKYKDDEGWLLAVVLPAPTGGQMYKYKATTAKGDEVLLWSSASTEAEAKGDFEAHHEPLKDISFMKGGCTFAELPVGNRFTFVLPNWAGQYTFTKLEDGNVDAFVKFPPPYTSDTQVEDYGPSLQTQIKSMRQGY